MVLVLASAVAILLIAACNWHLRLPATWKCVCISLPNSTHPKKRHYLLQHLLAPSSISTSDVRSCHAQVANLRCVEENEPRLAELLQARMAKAKLLGYDLRFAVPLWSHCHVTPQPFRFPLPFFFRFPFCNVHLPRAKWCGGQCTNAWPPYSLKVGANLRRNQQCQIPVAVTNRIPPSVERSLLFTSCVFCSCFLGLELCLLFPIVFCTSCTWKLTPISSAPTNTNCLWLSRIPPSIQRSSLFTSCMCFYN